MIRSTIMTLTAITPAATRINTSTSIARPHSATSDAKDAAILGANDLSRVELRYRDALEPQVDAQPAEVSSLVSGMIEQARRDVRGK